MKEASNTEAPRHIAIIMDGNGRWANERQLPRIAGHRAGVENVRVIVQRCAELGVKVLTLFAFSSENWRRPPAEVGLLLDLFSVALEQEVGKLDQNGVCLEVIGDRTEFPRKLRSRIEKAEQLTRGNEALTLVVAANYGGRWDITQAAKRIAEAAAGGTLAPDDIDEDTISKYLCLTNVPEPDLFIRSGGEQRISNYLLWQLAYTELYFTECLWPDFDAAEFDRALNSYSTRQRRFGMTGDQIKLADLATTSKG
ncbi:MAG: isoprenyl transferase [Gammaproteobacteria bacterium]|jgi:undecaprenyl diphosphate synthase|nr:isoprenyl transferase [Gammaproteobacteria bacterium]